MSNTDSFIDEVTEEVRRDRLFGYFRRYGWVGIALVVLIVGGAAYNEWQKSTTAAQSQAFGDALIAALDGPDAATRQTALAAIQTSGEKAALTKLLAATASLEAGDDAAHKASADLLAQVSSDTSLSPLWRDLADLRRVLVLGDAMPVAERRAILDAIAVPGRPYRTLAQEQLAMLAVEEGDRVGAIKLLTALIADQETPAGLRERAAQVIVVLGGEIPRSDG